MDILSLLLIRLVYFLFFLLAGAVAFIIIIFSFSSLIFSFRKFIRSLRLSFTSVPKQQGYVIILILFIHLSGMTNKLKIRIYALISSHKTKYMCMREMLISLSSIRLSLSL